MMRKVALILLCWCIPAFAANQTIFPVPAQNASFYTDLQNFLRSELPAVLSRYTNQHDFVWSGGIHTTSATMTSGAFATEAFTKSGNRVTADSTGGAVAINYALSGCATTDIAWVIISPASGNTLSQFTRAGTSNYFVDCTNTSVPVLPADAAYLMKVIFTGGVITAVYDLRNSSPLSSQIDITRYGADPTGTADSTAAIVNALAVAGARGGGQVFIPTGRFLISGTLYVPDNTEVVGLGKSSVIVMDFSMTTQAFVNSGYPTSAANVNIVLSSFSIEGGRLTPAGAFTGYQSVWNASLTFNSGQYMLNTRGINRIYRARAGCTTDVAGSGPSGNGQGIVDGTCVWDYIEELWTSATDPILFSRVTSGAIIGMDVSMSRNNCMVLESSFLILVKENTIRDCTKNGTYFSGGEYNSINSNKYSNNYGDFAFANVWYTSASSNTGKESVNYMIGLGRDARFNVITNNEGGRLLTNNESITGTAHGFTYPDPYDAYRYGFYDSVISGNSLTQIQLINSARNQVIGNRIVFPAGGDYGVWLLGAPQNEIINNYVYNGTSWSFVADTLSDGDTGSAEGDILAVQNRFIGNRVLDDRANGGTLGFYIGAGGYYATMYDNSVTLSPTKTLDSQHYTVPTDLMDMRDNVRGISSMYQLQYLTTASERYRGRIQTVPGGAGVQDLPYMVLKNTANTYKWEGVLWGPTVIGYGSTVLDPINLGDGGTSSANISIPGAQPGDIVMAGCDMLASASGNWSLSSYIQSVGLVRIVLVSHVSAGDDLPLGTCYAYVMRIFP